MLLELLKLCILVYYGEDEADDASKMATKPSGPDVKYFSLKHMEEASQECRPHVWIHGEVSMLGPIEKLMCAPFRPWMAAAFT